jgi:hypothetical protein
MSCLKVRRSPQRIGSADGIFDDILLVLYLKLRKVGAFDKRGKTTQSLLESQSSSVIQLLLQQMRQGHILVVNLYVYTI